jgi:hypothetical protein
VVNEWHEWRKKQLWQRFSLLIVPVTEELSKIKNVTNDKNARNIFTVKCKGIP